MMATLAYLVLNFYFILILILCGLIYGCDPPISLGASPRAMLISSPLHSLRDLILTFMSHFLIYFADMWCICAHIAQYSYQFDYFSYYFGGICCVGDVQPIYIRSGRACSAHPSLLINFYFFISCDQWSVVSVSSVIILSGRSTPVRSLAPSSYITRSFFFNSCDQ